MTDAIPGLYAKLPDDLKGSLYRSVRDYFGKPLVIHTAKIVTDDQGDKAVFVVSEDGGKKQFYLSTRATQPLAVAKWMIDSKSSPLRAVFVPRGRATFLIDPSAQVEQETQEELPF